MSAPKILIIDDDPDFVMSCRMVLEGEGYRVIAVGDPQEARLAVKSETPDLVILDLMMVHETDGIYLAKVFKSDSETAGIPILMMTSRRDFTFNPETDKEYLPVDEFIRKPAPPEELKKKVAQLLGR